MDRSYFHRCCFILEMKVSCIKSKHQNFVEILQVELIEKINSTEFLILLNSWFLAKKLCGNNNPRCKSMMLVKMKGLCNTCSQSEVTGAQCAAEARAEWRVTLQLGVCPSPPLHCAVSYSSISVLPFRHRFPFSLLRAATNTNRRRQ